MFWWFSFAIIRESFVHSFLMSFSLRGKRTKCFNVIFLLCGCFCVWCTQAYGGDSMKHCNDLFLSCSKSIMMHTIRKNICWMDIDSAASRLDRKEWTEVRRVEWFVYFRMSHWARTRWSLWMKLMFQHRRYKWLIGRKWLRIENQTHVH